MKIVFVAQPGDAFPSAQGASISIWIDAVASRFGPSHDIHVATSRIGNIKPGHRISYTIHHVSTWLDDKIETLVGMLERRLTRSNEDGREFYYRYYYFSRIYYIFYALAVARLARKLDADWVIVSNYSQFTPVIRFVARKSRIFLMMHCDWLVECPRKQIDNRLKHIDAVGGCSLYISDGIAERFPTHSHKCHSIHNACDLTSFDRPRDQATNFDSTRLGDKIVGRRVVLFVGRIAPEKGLHVLLKAMSQVKQVSPDAVLLVIGNISRQPPSPQWVFDKDPRHREFAELNRCYRTTIETLAEELGDAAIFMGHVDHDELADYYSKADIFVHPAVWNEPFGMILTEAMACGTVVVSTEAGGIPEIIEDGVTGLLVRPNSVEELAAAIIKLLRDDDLRKQLAHQGMQNTRSVFTWERTAQSMERIIEGQ